MSKVRKQVARTRARLAASLFFDRMARALLLAAGAWALATLAERLTALELPIWVVGGTAAGVALLGAIVATLVTRPTTMSAAVALDQAAGLKERISTAIAVERLDDPFARAAVSDAERVAGGLHVPAHIRVQAPALWPWSAASIIGAICIAAFTPSVDLFAKEGKDPAPELRSMAVQEHQAIKTELEKEARKIAELQEGNPDLKDVADKLEKLELPEAANLSPDDVRREAVRRIDDVQDTLRSQLESDAATRLEQVKKLLNELDKPGGPSRPSSPIEDSLAKGDFDSAQKQMQKLADEIREAAKNAGDPDAQKKLDELQKQLKDLSDKLKNLDDSKRLQKELEHKAGLSEEDARKLMEKLARMDPNQAADELKKQLASKGLSEQQLKELAKKLKQSQEAKKAAQDIAKKLSDAAKQCGKCQNPGEAGEAGDAAAQSLGEAGDMLSEMEMQQELMKELKSQSDRLGKLRDDLSCGRKPGDGFRNDNISGQGPQYGRGFGARIGETKTPHATTPEKANVRTKGGQVIGRMLVDGPAIRGQATAEELAAAQAEVRDALDAVEREDVPRQYQRVVQEYFERLAGLVGEREKSADPAPATQPAP